MLNERRTLIHIFVISMCVILVRRRQSIFGYAHIARHHRQKNMARYFIGFGKIAPCLPTDTDCKTLASGASLFASLTEAVVSYLPPRSTYDFDDL